MSMANRVYDKAFSFIAALGVVLHSRRAIYIFIIDCRYIYKIIIQRNTKRDIGVGEQHQTKGKENI